MEKMESRGALSTFAQPRLRRPVGNEKLKKQEPKNPDKCVNHPPGLKCKGTARLDKNRGRRGKRPGARKTAGAKAPVLFWGAFSARMNPCPFKTVANIEFFSKLKSRALIQGSIPPTFSASCKSAPFQNSGLRSQQRIETSQLRPACIWLN